MPNVTLYVSKEEAEMLEVVKVHHGEDWKQSSLFQKALRAEYNLITQALFFGKSQNETDPEPAGESSPNPSSGEGA